MSKFDYDVSAKYVKDSHTEPDFGDCYDGKTTGDIPLSIFDDEYWDAINARQTQFYCLLHRSEKIVPEIQEIRQTMKLEVREKY